MKKKSIIRTRPTNAIKDCKWVPQNLVAHAIKMIVDILMVILMLLEYSKLYTGQLLHEIFGITLFVLFIIHNLLNINFYKNLFNGKYNIRRIVMTVVNFSFLSCMLATIILGIPISQDVFRFLNLNGNMAIRKLHTIFGYWGLIILSIHLGLHFKMMFAKLNNKINQKFIVKILICLFELIIVVYGIKVMIDNNLYKYLIGEYSFGSYEGNLLMSVLNNFSIIISIVLIVYNLEKYIEKSKLHIH